MAVRAGGGPGIAVAALGWLAAMNVLLAAFNLLPGAPLDGGRILRAILWRRHGDRVRAARSAAAAGCAIGAVLIAVGIGEVLIWADASGLWLALIGMFVISAAAAEATAGTAAAALAGLRAGDVMTPDPDIGGTWMSVSDFIDRIALNSAQTGFPVIGPGGSLAGVTGSAGSPGSRRPAGPAPRCTRSWPRSRPPTWPPPAIRPPRCSTARH